MSKPNNSVSTKQTHALMAVLAQNVDWDNVSSDDVQALIKYPRDAGRKFTKFINGGTQSASMEPPMVRLVRTAKQLKNGYCTLDDMISGTAECGKVHGCHKYYLEHPDRIPESWRGKRVYFPDAVDRGGDGYRYLHFVDYTDEVPRFDREYVGHAAESNNYMAVPRDVY